MTKVSVKLDFFTPCGNDVRPYGALYVYVIIIIVVIIIILDGSGERSESYHYSKSS